MITHDPATWPTGDKIWDVCRAIAKAEGANIEGSNPDRLNNPGDISDGDGTFGSEHHTGSEVTHFPDKETGWKWLYGKIKRAKEGRSSVYLPTLTWAQFAQKYAGDWENWVNNVTKELSVSPTDVFGDFFNE